MTLLKIKFQLLVKIFEATLIACVIIGIAYYFQDELNNYIELRVATATRQELDALKLDITNLVEAQTSGEEYKHILRVLITTKKFTGSECLKLTKVVQDNCKRLSIAPDNFLALIQTESDFNSGSTIFHEVDGRVLEGLCGVRPCAKKEAIGNSKYNGADPVSNVSAFFRYYEYIKSLDRFKNVTDEIEIFKAWNRGPFHKNLDDALAQRYERKIIYYRDKIATERL